MAKPSSGGRLRAIIFLMVSVVVAVIAAVVIFQVINQMQAELRDAQKPPELKEIIVAKKTLWPGQTITDENLDRKKFPPRFIPTEAIPVAESAIGRVPLERILAHEFIRNERLAPREAGRGLNAIIPKGMRAIALDISGGSAVAGFLNPGNFVDILVTINDGERILSTITLLEAVTVLAVNERLGATEKVDPETKKRTRKGKKRKKKSGGKKEKRSRPSITIAVTPDQAEKVIYANQQGKITMTLRNDIDVTARDDHEKMNKSVLIGTGGADGDRIDLTEFNQRRPDDGTTIVIKGQKKEKQKTPR